MATIPNNEIDQASLQRLALNFYREALRGNIDFGGGSLPNVTEEQIEDAVAAMIAAGTQTGINIVYDDTAGTLSFTVTASGSTAALSDRAIPFNDNGTLEDSGMQVLASGQILAPRNFGVESGSVDFGDLVVLSEATGFLAILNRATGDTFNLVDHRAPKNAESSRPQYLHLTEAENEFEIFSTASDLLTATSYSMNYTTALLARTNSFRVQSQGATTNLRARVTDVASGVVVKYFPDKATWLSGVGGLDLTAGTTDLDLRDTPIVLDPNRQLLIEVETDSSTLLGDSSTSTPYLAAMVQRGEFRPLALQTEVAQADWNETDNTEPSYIQNKPTIPTPRTDEEIRDIMGLTLVAGTNVTIDVDDTLNTITINATGGGGTPPTGQEEFYHGLSDANNPADINLANLSQEDVGTGSGQQFTFNSGTSTNAQYLILLVPAAHDVTSIVNTGTNLNETPSFTKTNNVRQISGEAYHSYVLGPLVSGFNASYRVTLA